MKEKNQDENNKIPKGKGILQTIKEIEPIKIDMNKPITWEQLQEVFRKDRERWENRVIDVPVQYLLCYKDDEHFKVAVGLLTKNHRVLGGIDGITEFEERCKRLKIKI